MAKFNVVTDFNLKFLKGLEKAYPQAMYGVLNRIGSEGRRLMRAGLLSGNPIMLRKYPRDKAGRRTISYKILRGIKGVKISSYPLNLYNPRKQYSKITPAISGKLDSIVKEYDRQVFQKLIDKADKK
jgi:hypothetical protein